MRDDSLTDVIVCVIAVIVGFVSGYTFARVTHAHIY